MYEIWNSNKSLTFKKKRGAAVFGNEIDELILLFVYFNDI